MPESMACLGYGALEVNSLVMKFVQDEVWAQEFPVAASWGEGPIGEREKKKPRLEFPSKFLSPAFHFMLRAYTQIPLRLQTRAKPGFHVSTNSTMFRNIGRL